jgi:hypothetical protein
MSDEKPESPERKKKNPNLLLTNDILGIETSVTALGKEGQASDPCHGYHHDKN